MQGGQGGVRGERRGELNTARARRLIQEDVLPLKESSQQLGLPPSRYHGLQGSSWSFT